jgi:NAD(P)-dependent dehydrogenase (short-subunit alcohol dehydrogenase family)
MLETMKMFDQQVVIVTGASSGIGEAAALAFHAAGANVFGFASSEASRAAAHAKHPAIEWLAADLTRRPQIDAAVEAVTRAAGRLDVLVNNAGIYKFAALPASTDELVRSQFEINVFGVIALTQACLPALLASQGSIVNVSSTAAHKPMRDQSVYGATKAAVEALTRSWALELGAQRVRVNAVSPGPTETPGIARLLPPELLAAARAHITSLVPLGRIATPDDIAHWIVALADPRASWLTGQVIALDMQPRLRPAAPSRTRLARARASRARAAHSSARLRLARLRHVRRHRVA